MMNKFTYISMLKELVSNSMYIDNTYRKCAVCNTIKQCKKFVQCGLYKSDTCTKCFKTGIPDFTYDTRNIYCDLYDKLMNGPTEDLVKYAEISHEEAYKIQRHYWLSNKLNTVFLKFFEYHGKYSRHNIKPCECGNKPYWHHSEHNSIYCEDCLLHSSNVDVRLEYDRLGELFLPPL